MEKNLPAFLELEFEGSKYVVGDGPALPDLRRRFPKAHFVGAKKGEELASYYAAADVFVFPSLTDTFGLVMLEALASGVPVAAYPAPGPKDVVNGAKVGVLHDDLALAVRQALVLDPEECRQYATNFDWRSCTEQFLTAI